MIYNINNSVSLQVCTATGQLPDPTQRGCSYSLTGNGLSPMHALCAWPCVPGLCADPVCQACFPGPVEQPYVCVPLIESPQFHEAGTNNMFISQIRRKQHLRLRKVKNLPRSQSLLKSTCSSPRVLTLKPMLFLSFLAWTEGGTDSTAVGLQSSLALRAARCWLILHLLPQWEKK